MGWFTLIKGVLGKHKLLLFLGLGAVIAGFGYRTVTKIQDTSYQVGYSTAETKYLKLETERKVIYDTEVARLAELVATTEQTLADKLAEIERSAKQELLEVLDEKETTIAKLRTGNLRLSVELRRSAAASATTELAGSTALRHATYRAELSEAASEFFIGFAADADDAAVRLGQCQQTIRTYLETVADYNAKHTSVVP